MKKYTWMIVALLLALTFTFISCGVDPYMPPDNDPLEAYPLGDFNAFGGQFANQKGWATGEAFNFLGATPTKEGDSAQVAKNLNYDIEKFHQAKYLDLALKEGLEKPNGGVELIWGDDEVNGKGLGGWNNVMICEDNGTPKTGVEIIDGEKEGSKVLRIKLSAAMANYQKYLATDEVRVIIGYYQKGGIAELFDKATLQVSKKVAPFVPITDIKLKTNTFGWNNTLKLEAEFTPANATNQIVRWAIKSFQEPTVGGVAGKIYKVTGDPKAPDIEDEDENGEDITGSSYNDSRETLLGFVQFATSKGTVPVEVTDVWPFSSQKEPGEEKTLADTIKVPANTVGTITVVAFVENGDGEKDKDGNWVLKDYTKEFAITVTDVKGLVYKADGTSKLTATYGAVDNSGNGPSTLTVNSDSLGFVFDMKGNYGNSYYYIEIDFDTEKLGDYKGVKFDYKGVGTVDSDNNDYNNKSLRVIATKDKDSIKGYNPGGVIGVTDDSGDVSITSKSLTCPFGVGEINLGYPDPDVHKFSEFFKPLRGESKIYIWFLPWANPAEVEISNIEFIKTLP